MAGTDADQWLRDRMRHLETRLRHRTRRTVEAVSTTECRVEGQRCISFATNDYLGLAHHPAVREAFSGAASRQAGSTSSALIAGRTPIHEQLEVALAGFEHAAAALLFPTGFAANLGTLTALIGPRDAVFCDRLNHASLVDGCRASDGRTFVYRHDALDRLEVSLRRRRRDFERGFLVTDTIFSMDGTAAPLPELCRMARQFDMTVIVDEAHATGVSGPTGRGVCEEHGVADQVAVRIGTLSKALGCLGGFVVGSAVTVDWLWNRARTQFFSTSLPPAVCAAALCALRLIDEEPQRRILLQQRTRFAIQRAAELGLHLPDECVGPIVPVIVGADERAVALSEALLEAGLFVPAVRPPTVPEGTARLRLSLTCEHTLEQVDDALVRTAALIG